MKYLKIFLFGTAISTILTLGVRKLDQSYEGEKDFESLMLFSFCMLTMVAVEILTFIGSEL